jgi:hypothetical protein
VHGLGGHRRRLLAASLGVATLGASPAFAGGAFDFLDPCIKARSDFAGQAQQIRARYDNLEASIATMTATPEFREVWVKAKRQQARPIFDAEVAPQLAKYGVKDMDQAFDAWFKDMIASVDPSDLQNLINTTYRLMAREELAGARTKTESDDDKAKSELDRSCKRDVGSQVLRVTMAPIGWVAGNIDAAKNERNIFTQVFRGVTGISAKDIAEHGPLGGENSELRKLVNGIAGGENSEIRKGAPVSRSGQSRRHLRWPQQFFS